MHTVTNPIQACNDIFFRPNGVFKAVNEHNNWSWIPFIIVVLMGLLPQYLYLNTVDFGWYQDTIINAQYGDLSPAEQDTYRQGMTKTAITAFAVVGTVIGMIVINAIVATYLNLATRSDETNANGFTDWYGFTWWAGMPIVFSALIGIVLLLLNNDPQISPAITLPLSLAYWFNVPMTSDWFAFLQSIRLDTIWSIYLTMVGVSQWTSFSVKKSAVVAIAPFAIIWSIWLLVVVL